jgi:hypothetical protein
LPGNASATAVDTAQTVPVTDQNNARRYRTAGPGPVPGEQQPAPSDVDSRGQNDRRADQLRDQLDDPPPGQARDGVTHHWCDHEGQRLSHRARQLPPASRDEPLRH